MEEFVTPGRRALRFVGAVFVFWILHAGTAAAADYYVDSAQGSNGNAGTATAPFRNFWRLNGVLKPGDTAHILPGDYTEMLSIQVSGVSGAPITYLGSLRRAKRPKIVVAGNFGVHFAPGVHHVIVKGLDIRSTDKSGVWSGPGVHHLVISNNVVHDCGGSGIGVSQADYVTIRDNAVFNNAWTNPQQGSGINLRQMKNFDDSPRFHNRISGNVVYNNANKVFKEGKTQTSDGNGIILDDNRHTQDPSIGPAYTGATLIENNVVFNNGGRGVHIFQSDHVTVRANTVYWNNWDPHSQDWHSGEVEAYRAGSVTVYNNILYSRGSTTSGPDVAFSAEWTTGGPVIADHNLTFGAASHYFANSSLQSWGANNIQGDPRFAYRTTSPGLADFRVTAGSPALSLGKSANSLRTDILGDRRPTTGKVTAGAYQKMAP